MNRSLSVLLPVHNVQRSLCGSVHAILDIVAELTGRFELVIVDDHSTDGTWEAAQELARDYPQVRLLRKPAERLAGQAIHRLVHSAYGDVVIAHDGSSPIDADEIVRLWRRLAPAAPAPKLIRTPMHGANRNSRLAATAIRSDERATWTPVRTEECRGFRVLRPASIEELRRSLDAAQNVVSSRGLKTTLVDPQSATAPSIDAGDSQTRRPNFLSRVSTRVRDFTRGE